MALILYRIIWLFLSPLVFAWSLHQLITRRGGLDYLLERSGLGQRSDRATPVWFHVASVGEMRLATPLINAVLERGLLITCNTPEAYRLAASTWGDAVTLRYCPIDYRSFVKRFIGRYTPSLVFIIETEIWPELYEQCHQKDIAIYIVNGRLSDKTLRSRLARAWLYPMTLRRISGIWAREEEDASRFAAMGCPPDKIRTTGSIKMTRRLHSSVPENPLPPTASLPWRFQRTLERRPQLQTLGNVRPATTPWFSFPDTPLGRQAWSDLWRLAVSLRRKSHSRVISHSPHRYSW